MPAALVLDVGKTHSKLSLWDSQGNCLGRRSHANRVVDGPGYRALDSAGIERWLMDGLREFAARAEIAAIVPLAHGAAAALVCESGLFAPPMDYEDASIDAGRADYESERDAFEATGSPALPHGLNLGAQLHALERRLGDWPADLRILPWPQYWAWWLCGVAASEVSSLGCHTDLWRPAERRFSDLAVRRGWAQRIAPLRAAGEALGMIRPDLADQTGLPRDCRILCGLHDSNAALLAARYHSEIAADGAATVATGTWFIAMRGGDPPSLATGFNPRRDCLLNVDVTGRPVPSARFMGGREAELAGGDLLPRLLQPDDGALAARLERLVAEGRHLLPTLAVGTGPFAALSGGWRSPPADPADRAALLGLYLALMSDVMLDLVGSDAAVLVEGRFAAADAYVRSLATLRRDQTIHRAAECDAAFGALRLAFPSLSGAPALPKAAPLDIDLAPQRRDWLDRIAGAPR